MEIKVHTTRKKTNISYKEHNGLCIEKQCTNCEKWYPYESFANSKLSYLGKSNACPKCESARILALNRAKGIPPKQPSIITEEEIVKRPCSRCKFIKSLDDFDVNPSGYLGHDSECSECKRRRGELYRRSKGIKAPRIVSILTNSSGEATHRECSRCKEMLSVKQFNKHKLAYLGVHPYCKECSSARHLMGKYGMTPEDKSHMYLLQNNCCATCLEFVELVKIHVDHCHKTGKVRGLLCSACNKALGLLKDNPQRCMNMAAYLQTNAVADKHTK